MSCAFVGQSILLCKALHQRMGIKDTFFFWSIIDHWNTSHAETIVAMIFLTEAVLNFTGIEEFLNFQALLRALWVHLGFIPSQQPPMKAAHITMDRIPLQYSTQVFLRFRWQHSGHRMQWDLGCVKTFVKITKAGSIATWRTTKSLVSRTQTTGFPKPCSDFLNGDLQVAI